ncbi:hypothetical protein V1509DRAFT_633265 [Lipomyces kononenkoae]
MTVDTVASINRLLPRIMGPCFIICGLLFETQVSGRNGILTSHETTILVTGILILPRAMLYI